MTFPDVPLIPRLDVRQKKGSYLVTTRSGAHYTVAATRRISGAVTVSGGSTNLKNFEGVVGAIAQQYDKAVEPIIVVGQPLVLSQGGKIRLSSTRVRKIRRIDGLSPEHIEALMASDRAEETARPKEWWEEPPPVIYGFAPTPR